MTAPTATYNKNILSPITECLVCGSAVYDNTGPNGKKSPKSPDYKCKANGDHAFWLPKKNGAASVPAARSVPGFAGAAPAGSFLLPEAPPPTEKFSRLQSLFELHDLCLAHAIKQGETIEQAVVADTVDAISSRCATTFIQACKNGLAT